MLPYDVINHNQL